MNKFKKEVLKAVSLFKRFILGIFIRDYELKRMQCRKGKCKKCGKCCGGCRHLDKKTRLCKVYHKRPFLCYKNFPLCDFDKKVWDVEKSCGYGFDK